MEVARKEYLMKTFWFVMALLALAIVADIAEAGCRGGRRMRGRQSGGCSASAPAFAGGGCSSGSCRP
jgi:uncharacterized membrane protein YgcG